LRWEGEEMWLPHIVASCISESTSEARRLIKQGAVSVNGVKIADIESKLKGDREYILRVGKRKFVRVVPHTSAD